LNLVGTSGQTWGAALCVKGVSKPIFVSVGHRISLETAIGITVACSEFRIPAPVRAADLGSREMLRQMAEENVESI
jgi:deoxyinosine 3'endonuclease (endonuclease V)